MMLKPREVVYCGFLETAAGACEVLNESYRLSGMRERIRLFSRRGVSEMGSHEQSTIL
jgi:hypothetical protein